GIRTFHVTGVQTCALPIYEPIDQVKVLERPSFTEIIAKLVMGAPGEIVLPQVELEEVKPKEEKKPTGKSPAREVKEKAEPRESDLEAQYDAVPNSEGNHLTPDRKSVV